MSYERWRIIRSCITYDLDTVVDELNSNFKKFWIPTTAVVVDESMCAWSGLKNSKFFDV